jgi:hypothetical protein
MDNDGDRECIGDVALRGLLGSLLSCSETIRSLIVRSRSNVACRRARRDDEEPLDWSRPPNMTLYRSMVMSGISTSRRGPCVFPVPAEGVSLGFCVERPAALGLEDEGADMLASAGVRMLGTVSERMMIGLCFGAWRSVLLRSRPLLCEGRVTRGFCGAGAGSGFDLLLFDRPKSFHRVDFDRCGAG